MFSEIKNLKAIVINMVYKILPYRKINIPEDEWDKGYSKGDWDYLHSLQQRMRYKVIACYFSHFGDGGSVLDVGCGDGYLQEIIAIEGFSKYLGIDISAKAIESAKYRENETTKFIKADVNTFQVDERFNVIIFNECIYYFDDPISILNKYTHYLTEDGVFVISMFGPLNRSLDSKLWKKIQSKFTVIDEVIISHGSGKSWTIKVLDK